MSVGAAIVIAKPDESAEKTPPDEPANKSADHKWTRNKAFGFGKIISKRIYRTKQHINRIGNTLSALI